jgi:hypothetical protein
MTPAFAAEKRGIPVAISWVFRGGKRQAPVWRFENAGQCRLSFG